MDRLLVLASRLFTSTRRATASRGCHSNTQIRKCRGARQSQALRAGIHLDARSWCGAPTPRSRAPGTQRRQPRAASASNTSPKEGLARTYGADKRTGAIPQISGPDPAPKARRVVPARSAVVPRSIVERRSDLPLGPAEVIVLDPQLGVILLHKIFDLLPALRGLLSIWVRDRNFLKRHLFRIVIEIA